MSGFSADWLQRREPYDAAARSGTLAREFGAALGPQQSHPKRIIDLAAGSGANFRVLAPLIGGDQDWLLVDHDPQLIATQAVAIERWAEREGWRCSRNDESLDVMAGTSTWRVRARRIDLAHALEQIDATDCDGVTTTAFLDLVSAAWLDRLGAWLARSKLPLLATLSVDGRRLWRPALPADAHLLAAFQRHQTGDKGFGPALGGTAVDALAQRLAAQAYDVKTIRSDWQVGAADRDLLQQMVAESAAVATETEPAHAADFAAWSATRSAQIAAGALALAVGHLDLLAVPTR